MSVAGPADQLKYINARRRFINVWTLVGVAALVVIVTCLLNILSMPVGIIIWTAIICFILSGPVSAFEKRGIPRWLGTLFAYMIMFAVLGVLLFILFMPPFGITSQFGNMLDTLPNFFLSVTSALNGFYDRYADVFQNPQIKSMLDEAMASLYAWASDFASTSASSLVAAGTTIANTLFVVGFALVVAFWMLIEIPNLAKEFRRILGDSRKKDITMLYATCTRVMGGYIKGTLIQCAVIGVGCGIMFGVLGAPNAAALGAITGIMNIIPVVGPWLGGLVAALSCLFISPFAVVVSLLGTIVIQQAVYMLVSPKVMGNAVDIHPALTFIALVAGGAIGGAMSGTAGSLVGALLSIPAVAVLKSVFVYYFEERTGRRIVSPEGVFFKVDVPREGFDPMVDATGYSFDELEEKQEAEERAEEALRRAMEEKRKAAAEKRKASAEENKDK